ncbi:LLM class flavin-dependent oxidoreductase [Amycolatopsis sp. K13G38]|uniref:LLM class flavin-dependent oxidoreductase n=1 Tax=Amycolatopsis acididurans TaxID=2724524 RepID=A0ABX1J7I4_9PSEU|nr:LLM class flavin-dependent oxidoreductase [Amycolatopsis acididurans]NKQ55534.1 LLM class flavin-dependent oxidoreductase [Amycolatopsis acididurans]
MPSSSPIPVGVRLPLAGPEFAPAALLELSRRALELGYDGLWVGDHVLLPEASSSPYPHTGDGIRPFRADTPWLDPLLQLTWLAGQLPTARFGTSVLILTLRNPALIAKQLATMSWLTGRPVSLGVGSGWLREEYDALGVPFEHRATRAKKAIAEIRELLTGGRRDYVVRGQDDEPRTTSFVMAPTAPAPVEFLWGGFSPAALRLIASSCDGWLPAKQSPDELAGHVRRLKSACDDAHRDFGELKLVVKPGPGPDPDAGGIDKDSLAAYAELGFREAILEMPYDTGGLAGAVATLERVAARSWP